VSVDQRLESQLMLHEGLRLLPYRCTSGDLTIGVGRNLERRGITAQEARMLLLNDIAEVRADLNRAVPWWTTLNETRQIALMDLCFNLGIGGLLGFKRMLAALKSGDYESAADEVLDSRYARQVGQRATTISQQIRGTKK
jgi:lysozyme